MKYFIEQLSHINTKRVLAFFFLFFMISMGTHQFLKDKLNQGVSFFLWFFTVMLYDYTFILFMIVTQLQEKSDRKNPFHLFKFVTYAFLILMFLAPLLYLWSMRDQIVRLQW